MQLPFVNTWNALWSPHRVIALTWILALACGCATQRARVGISEPAVFTLPHIAAAQRAYAEDTAASGAARELSPFGDMQRYFASTTSGWDRSRLRMDEMLDQTQQFESFARVLVQSLDIKASFGKEVTAPTTNDAKPATDPTAIDAADAQALASVLAASPNDSPHDRVERARAFFSSYVLALLRLYGTDSRVLDVDSFDPIATVEANPATTDESPLVKAARAAIGEARTLSGYAMDEDARKKILESLQSTLKDRSEALDQRQKDANAAMAFVTTASAEIGRTLRELGAARSKLAKAQDALRAAASEKDKENARAVVEASTAVVAERQAHCEAAEKDYNRLTALHSDSLKAVTVAERALDGAEAALNDFVWQGAREKALAAVTSDHIGTGEKPHRLILLLFEVHVEPGNMPDQVVGLEAAVQSVKPPPDQARVIHVHPGRLYDTADQRMFDRVQRAMSLAMAAKPGNATLDADADSHSRDEVRGRYLSRINKTASFAACGGSGAQDISFGWYFYPSNVVVEKSLFGGYEAVGFLEAGGRDCAVWLMVPQTTESLTLQLTPVLGSLNHGDYEAQTSATRTVTISLPKYSPVEHYVAVNAAMGPAFLAPTLAPGPGKGAGGAGGGGVWRALMDKNK